MKQLMKLERLLHKCPEIDLDDEEEWPLISNEELCVLEYECRGQHRYDVNVFPFFREKEDGTNYLEVYFLFPKNRFQKYERFVICEGYRLSAKKESRFLEYVREKQLCYEQPDNFYSKLNELYPSRYLVHYIGHRPYWFSQTGQQLEYHYYISHRSGAKELLYKSGLIDIAWNLHKIPSLNLAGTTPESIIGMPLKLLRILDCSEKVGYLFKEDTIELCKKTYSEFRDQIGNEYPSDAQWEYLCSLSNGDSRFNAGLYEALKYADWRDDTLEKYKQFKQLSNELKNVICIGTIRPKNIEHAVSMLESLKKYKDSRVDDIADFESIRQKYEYYSDDYIVVMPRTSVDIFKEAYYQGNCLMSYMERVLNGETYILFLRKRESPDRSFVTMEICDNKIIQVRSRFNNTPDETVLAFVEKYAQAKDIIYCSYKNEFPEGLF